MKKLYQFLFEGLVLGFVIFVLLGAIVVSSSVSIVYDMSFFSMILVIALIGILVYVIPPFYNTLKAIIDLIFKQTLIVKGIITDIVPSESTCFTERWIRVLERGQENRYSLLVDSNGTLITMIIVSANPPEKNRKCTIKYARFSHVVLRVDINPQ